MRLVDPDRFTALKATGKLPSPKGVALSIIRLLQRDDFRIADLVHLVQSDPAIAGRILYFANAAAFGRSRPIVSLHRATVALGSFRVRDLVIGLSVMQDHRGGQCAAFDYERFWGHSLATGIACEELSQIAQIPSEELFTIGLLARIGELALATLFPNEYSDILQATRENPPDATALEHRGFGMDHHELGASLLSEWGLPEMLIQAAFHHESPEAAGFADGSRVQMLIHALSFASALAHVCLADEESRWSLLPALLAKAARLGISGEALNDIVDRTVERWRDWGAKLQVRTQALPPFAEILAATPPVRRMNHFHGLADRRSGNLCLHVQLIGIPLDELPALMQKIERTGHQPIIVDDSAEGLIQALRRPPQVIIADLSDPRVQAMDFCRNLRNAPKGRECFVLFLIRPELENRISEAIEAGADDVLVKPVTEQTLRIHINMAARMLSMRDEIHRERQGIMRSTDEFAAAHKRLLQDALTDPLTALPNRRKGLDFLASEALLSQSTGTPLACLMIDIDHFKPINDTYGHAAGDTILCHLAKILKRTSRAEDLVFRYGGEEFVAVLTHTSLHNALRIAERMRAHVEKTSFRWEKRHIPVTVSIGVASGSGRQMDASALIEAADAALYRAKQAGRNRVRPAE